MVTTNDKFCTELSNEWKVVFGVQQYRTGSSPEKWFLFIDRKSWTLTFDSTGGHQSLTIGDQPYGEVDTNANLIKGFAFNNTLDKYKGYYLALLSVSYTLNNYIIN